MIKPNDNFTSVLESAYDSYPDNPQRDYIGIVLGSDNQFLSESLNFTDPDDMNEMALNVTNPHIVQEKRGKGISVTVNGKEYRYVSPYRSTEDLFKSFMGQMRYANAGYKALNWLKKNALCYYGSKDPSGKDLVESTMNDENEVVPKKCTNCGGDVKLYIEGEPIYKCSKCGKFYGVARMEESEVIRDTSNHTSVSVADGTSGPNLSNPKMKGLTNESTINDDKYNNLKGIIDEYIAKGFDKLPRGTKERDDLERLKNQLKSFIKRHGYSGKMNEITQASAIPPNATDIGVVAKPPRRFNLGEALVTSGDNPTDDTKPIIPGTSSALSVNTQAGYKIRESYFREDTTGMPYYDAFLDKESAEVLKTTKNLVAEIKYLTPDEYLSSLANDIFGCSVDRVMKGVNDELVSKYAVSMQNGEKFDLPTLDLANKTQEGRHRILAARRLGAKSVPVLVINKSK